MSIVTILMRRMSKVIITYKDKTWKVKSINYHNDLNRGVVALYIVMRNNHRKLFYPAHFIQRVDEDNNFRIDISEGRLIERELHEMILGNIQEDNIRYVDESIEVR